METSIVKGRTYMQLKDIPPAVLRVLRVRGHKDEVIAEMSPRQMFIEYGEWHGIPYPDTFFDLAVALGGAEAAGKTLTQDKFPH
jgi:hypothetical protein